jgi:hypothetical protein
LRDRNIAFGEKSRCGRPAERPLTKEQKENTMSIHFSDGEGVMIRTSVEQAAALVAVALFVDMIAVRAGMFSPGR